MKRLVWCVSLALCAAPVAMMAQTVGAPGLEISARNRTISVSATDHAEAEPDVADLSVGFVVYGATLKDAYKTASDSSNAIMKAMLDAGAVKTEIQSRSQRVSRLSDYEMKAQKGMKYSVSQSWTASVEPKLAAVVLDAAVQAGANESGDMTWRLKNSVALDDEAIARATKRAMSMAAELAKDTNVVLGKPMYVTNSVSSNVVTPRFMANAFRMKSADSTAPAPLAVEAERVEATATVQVIFGIE